MCGGAAASELALVLRTARRRPLSGKLLSDRRLFGALRTIRRALGRLRVFVASHFFFVFFSLRLPLSSCRTRRQQQSALPLDSTLTKCSSRLAHVQDPVEVDETVGKIYSFVASACLTGESHLKMFSFVVLLLVNLFACFYLCIYVFIYVFIYLFIVVVVPTFSL